jgi:VWFA-related protein
MLPPQPAWKKTEGTAANSHPGQGASSPPELAPVLRQFGTTLYRNANEPMGPAADNRTADEDVVRVDTDLVVCPMLVVDAQGNIIRGLTREDFIVNEDGKLQEVATLSMGDNKDLTRSIVLIIDYSGSQLPYINTSIESAKMLVDKLNPKDRMAIVTDDVRLLVDFTGDKQLLKTRLESLKTSALGGNIGASEQYDALLASLNELFDSEDVRPIIIFQTDGDELESLKGGPGLYPYLLPKTFGLEDILTATEKRRASIYSVISGVRFTGLPNSELPKRARRDWDNRQKAQIELMRAKNIPVQDEKTPDPPDKFLTQYGTQWLNRQTALMGLAKFTGTLPEFLEDPSQADEIYTRVLNDIDRRYVIGYYPTNRARDGKRRIVNIAVRDHPEYVVWGQKSYFARKEQ